MGDETFAFINRTFAPSGTPVKPIRPPGQKLKSLKADTLKSDRGLTQPLSGLLDLSDR
jgi:hypothetical protein